MEQYIDKSAVVAEIEGYIYNYKDIVAKTDRNDSTWVDFVSMIDAKIDVLQHLLSFLNTIEVKEVDINKEISQFIDANFEKATIGHKLSLRRVAKHFFELGLKAKKGE